MNTPNPGSDEALEAGCTCPVLDNNHGRWSPRPPDGWFVVLDCPLHGSEIRAQMAAERGDEPGER